MKFFTEMLYDTAAGILEVHFERVGNPSTIGYRVAVIKGTSATWNFTMQEREGQWKIADAGQLPEWLRSFEGVLSDSISAHITRSKGLKSLS